MTMRATTMAAPQAATTQQQATTASTALIQTLRVILLVPPLPTQALWMTLAIQTMSLQGLEGEAGGGDVVAGGSGGKPLRCLSHPLVVPSGALNELGALSPSPPPSPRGWPSSRVVPVRLLHGYSGIRRLPMSNTASI